MQVDYKRDLNHSYMIIKEEKEPDIASYQIRMLQTNSIEGLLACRMQKMNTQMLYYYDISSRQALQTVYEHRQVGYQTIKILFQQLIEVVEKLEGYLLEPEGLLLAPNTVYFTAELQKVTFCYLPGNKCPIQEQLMGLMEYLLPKMNHQEAEVVILGYGLYKEISSDEWSIDRMKSILLRKPEMPEKNMPAEESGKEEEEQGDMRKKAMESFFEEEEEEERESPVWTAAAVAGGIAVLGMVLYLMHATGVPAVMYLIMMAAAGISVSVIAVWMKRKEQQEREEEMTNFLKKSEQDGEEKETIRQQPKEPSGKNGRSEKKGKYEETYRALSGTGDERNGIFSLEDTGNEEIEEICNGDKTVCGAQRTVRREIITDAAQAEEHWKRKQISRRQLYQKTEPLYRCPEKESFRLVPVSNQELPQITVSGEKLTVGKLDAVVDVVLPFSTVSRLHARLQCAGGNCIVTDLNSSNGTYVNEVQLEGEVPCKLEDGDEVSFADIKYQVLKG